MFRRSLLRKVACCRPIVLLKTNSFESKEPFSNEAELLCVRVVYVLLKSVAKTQEWVGFYSQYKFILADNKSCGNKSLRELIN